MKHRPYTKLKGELKERKVTYRDIGSVLGISISAVSNKISGVSDFYLSEVYSIEAAYGLGYQFFMP